MTSKERAVLKTQAMKINSIFQIGKSSLSPAQVDAMKSALQARELIKVSVLKNCGDDPEELAEVIAERTGSQVVQVIGKKIVLYKKNARKEAEKKRAGKLQQQKRGMREGKREMVGGKRNERLKGREGGRKSRAARHG